MAFSETELVFLALILIFTLVFLLLGRRNNTSTAKNTKKKKKESKRAKRWSKHDGSTWAPNSWTLCWALWFIGGKNTARFFCLLSCPILAWVAVINSNRLVLKSNRFGSMFLDKFKLQRINFSPTRAGSLHEKCLNVWKNSKNSHFWRDVFLGSYGPAYFLLIFTMRLIKSLIVYMSETRRLRVKPYHRLLGACI